MTSALPLKKENLPVNCASSIFTSLKTAST